MTKPKPRVIAIARKEVLAICRVGKSFIARGLGELRKLKELKSVR
jgi:hypothetical protein